MRVTQPHFCDRLSNVCARQQLPPEAWLRLSLPHASVTHLVVRANGNVSVRSLGDAGHLPPELVSY